MCRGAADPGAEVVEMQKPFTVGRLQAFRCVVLCVVSALRVAATCALRLVRGKGRIHTLCFFWTAGLVVHGQHALLSSAGFETPSVILHRYDIWHARRARHML